MSYCRWSSMDGKCNIYAYESASGYQIHVAKSKQIDDPEPEPTGSDWKSYMDWHSRNYKPSGLPYDGQDFLEHSLEDFKARMLELRRVGYIFPDYVLEQIDEDIEERDNSNG